jgi:hypothetical protein
MTSFEAMLKVLSATSGADGNRLAELLRPMGRRRRRAGRGSDRVSKYRVTSPALESLEQRLAMTINIFTNAFAPSPNWFVITSDNADEVYVQQVATSPQDLLVADNPSFNNSRSLGSFHADNTLWNGIGVYSQMYVTNGTRVSASASATDVSSGTRSLFVLTQQIPDKDAKVKGVIGAVNGSVVYAGNVWNFDNGGQGSALNFRLAPPAGGVSNPSLITPSGRIVNTDGGAAGKVSAVSIDWSAPAVAPPGGIGPYISAITYDVVAATANTPATTLTEGFLQNAAGSDCFVQLPVTPVNPGGMVPGTLTGSLTVDGSPNPVAFQMNSLFPQVNKLNSLYFNGSNGVTGKVTINSGTTKEKTIDVTGEVDYNKGIISLHFKEGGKPINPGAVSLSADYAVYNQDAATSTFTVTPGHTIDKQLYVDLLTPGSTIAVNSPIVQTLNSALGELSLRATNVNLDAVVQAGKYLDIGSTDATGVNAINRDVISRTAVASAIVGPNRSVTAIGLAAGQGGQGYDDGLVDGFDVQIVGGGGKDATAKAFSLNGVVDRVVVTNPGTGYTSIPTVIIPAPQATDSSGNSRLLTPATAYTEQVTFNAQVTAPAYDIRVSDDPSTLAVRRGRMFVSSTGSLTTQGSGAADSLYVQADTSDVYVEGTINASRQSYLFRSPDAAGPLAPFVFSTTSPQTGASTGLIQGGTVAISLGNDLPTMEQTSVAINTVDLRAYVDSMRVRATNRRGDSINGPFPYDLKINQIQDAGHPTKRISFDGVAASGRGISLSAAGDIGFTAAVTTWGDLSISAGDNFDITAPLSTARGQVAITANTINVNNSLQVLAAAPDSSRDDITLTAKGGDLTLKSAVTAVNNVRLIQRNKVGQSGRISGPARVVANGISVESEGSASLQTDAATLSGRAAGDFTVDELNDISIPSLRSPGMVTLRAAGTDPGAESPFSANSIALTASLYDVTSLDVSAPRGSVAITTDTSKTLTLGNAAAIASGKATSMQAAGSVTIRSLAGPVVVADAPLGGGGAITARFAFADNLPGLYNQGTPGLFASTLTGANSPLVSEEGVALAVGDRILLRGQANQNENGVYVVTVRGSLGRNWVLTRASDADTSGELLAGGFVRVLEGLYADTVYRIGYDPTVGESPLAVSMVPNRAGAEAVRVATTSTLAGSYNSGMGTISAAGSLPLIDGVSVSVGDRVLVRMGTVDSPPAGTSVTPLPVSSANGVYEVVSVGGVSGRWSLARATNIDTGSAIETGYVLTTEGSYRAAATGQVFAVSYESLGIDPLTFMPLAAELTATDIGTEDINDVTTFVVSSTAGSNTAAGSLGKMIAIRQALGTGSELNPAPKVDFAFSTNLPALAGGTAGAIRLTQELPAISKAFAIDGANRRQLPGGPASSSMAISIDGSRITTTRTGQPAASAESVNGIEFVNGSQSSIGSAGGSVSNLTIGGFATGAAVKINGVNGILVNKMVLGRNATGDRLANKFGVLATASRAGGTVSGSTIVGSTQAGIRTESGATGLSVVGTTVGAANQGNRNGIELTDGSTSVGINQVLDSKSAIKTTRDLNYITLPPTISPRSLHLGQVVSGPGIQPGTTIAAIDGLTVTLSKPMTVTAATTGIRFAAPARNTVQYNLTGIALSSGNNTVTNTAIATNVYSGVVVQGGIQQIGTGRKVTGTSNLIYGNGRYGVEVSGATAAIIGNSFGVQGRNQGGNVYDNGAVDATPKYKPNARTRLDGNGNFHAVTAANAGSGRRLSSR